MNRHINQVAIATLAVFVGSLIADVVLGDGIQSEDINQAVFVAAIAGAVQVILNCRK